MSGERRGEDHQAIDGGIDEWDQDFLNAAIQIELKVISSRNLPSNDLVADSLASPPYPNPTSIAFDGVSGFSPPRELSQRAPGIAPPEVFGTRAGIVGATKERELAKLKRELGRVSEKLDYLEHECLELKWEGAKKDQQLKCALSEIEAKDAEIHSLIREASRQDNSRSTCQIQNTDKCSFQSSQCPVREDKCLPSCPHVLERTTEGSNNKFKRAAEQSEELSFDFQCRGPKRTDVQSDGIYAVPELKRLKMSANNSTTSQEVNVPNTSYNISAQLKYTKTVGIQTEQESSFTALKDIPTVEHNLSSKLLVFWGSPICSSSYYKRPGRDLVSKLFLTCSVDFGVLFSCMSTASKIGFVSKKDESFSDVGLFDCTSSVQSIDAAKALHLYVILMKMHNEMAQLPALLEALLDMCTLENVFVVYRSLRILRAIFQHCSSFDLRSDGRNNVLVNQSLNNSHENKESPGVQNRIVDIYQYDEMHNGSETSGLFPVRSFDLKTLCKDEKESSSDSSAFSSENWVSVIKVISQIALRKAEHLQIEAVSIMNLILMRSNPILEREKFELMPLLEIVSHLLQEEVSLNVRLQAVRLLFLLLNCPKLLMIFCSGGKDITDIKDASALQKERRRIINGLSKCLSCVGVAGSLQELKLGRQVLVLLAYVAASSKSGFEILFNTEKPHGFDFLESIIRVLAFEMDAEETADFSSEAQLLLHKERCLVMREALILLNRLASHPAHSKATLGALTRNIAVARITVDVANRISQKKSRGGSIQRRTHMEAEIVDLARLLRARVFGFLGENAS